MRVNGVQIPAESFEALYRRELQVEASVVRVPVPDRQTRAEIVGYRADGTSRRFPVP